jgi:hypothetical protein
VVNVRVDWPNVGIVVVLIVFALLIGAGISNTLNAATAPTPRETPWLWVDPDPAGGACYVLADTLGPCFSKPSPEAK